MRNKSRNLRKVKRSVAKQRIIKVRMQRRAEQRDLLGKLLLSLSEASVDFLFYPTNLLHLVFLSVAVWHGYMFGLNDQALIINKYDRVVHRLERKTEEIPLLHQKIKMQEQKIIELFEKNKELKQNLLEKEQFIRQVKESRNQIDKEN